TAIHVGDRGEAAVLFDRGQMRYAAGWTGAYLVHSDKRFGLLDTPRPAGPIVFATSPRPGRADPDRKWDRPHPATAPLPADWAKFKGLHLHGKHVVLEYTVGGVSVLDSPWAETKDGLTVLTRTLEVGPSEKPLTLLVCEVAGDKGWLGGEDGLQLAGQEHDGATTQVALAAKGGTAKLRFPETRGMLVEVPPAKETRRFKLFLYHGSAADRLFLDRVKASPPAADLADWTKPGPSRWHPLVTQGEVAADDHPYAIDTLTVPSDTPSKAVFFTTAIAFLPTGDLAVCPCHGAVWMVRGVAGKLENLTWKRFATGLYQPLGLKVVGGKVVVL